jgi:hypothetical protein
MAKCRRENKYPTLAKVILVPRRHARREFATRCIHSVYWPLLGVAATPGIPNLRLENDNA